MTHALASLLINIGSAHGLPAELLPAIAWVESRGHASPPTTRGDCAGMFQLSPGVRRLYGVQDARNVRASANAAARYLASLQRRLGGWPKAIVAYNGKGAAAERYLHRVLVAMGRFAP